MPPQIEQGQDSLVDTIGVDILHATPARQTPPQATPAYHPQSENAPGSPRGLRRMRTELLAERGIEVTYETIRQWGIQFGPAIARDLRSRRLRPHPRCHMDEMF